MTQAQPSSEAAVAKTSDLQDGEMKQVAIGDTKVLLTRIDGQFYAVGAQCSHYQAPLAKGVLSGNQVFCPWHHACFDVTTGVQQEAPGLDDLDCYSVRIEAENVIVQVPATAQGQHPPHMAAYDPEADARTFVIVGAGAAGAHAVETLRAAGYQGRIILVTQEADLPYDRTKLSKDYLFGKAQAEDLPLRSTEFYAEHQIEVWLEKRVVQVDATAKTIQFESGEPLQYDALLVATGGKPRSLNVPGADLNHVFGFRSLADSQQILAIAPTVAETVVIGSSFISMEAAAGLTQRGTHVTVVSPDAVPFEKVLGKEIGQVFQRVQAENGVTFKLNAKVARIEGETKVEQVVLETGETLPADLVIVGIGVQPATDFLSGVDRHEKDQSVIVNEYLEATAGLYAAGDIARYPDWRSQQQTRIEHWRIAAQQGRIAAHNMLGQNIPFRSVPLFWTLQFKTSLRYVGHASDWDEVLIDGDLQKPQFLALYIKDDRILAAASSDRDQDLAAIHALMRLDQLPSVQTVRQGGFDWLAYLKQH